MLVLRAALDQCHPVDPSTSGSLRAPGLATRRRIRQYTFESTITALCCSDLGTTNSLITIYGDDGPVIIPNAVGDGTSSGGHR